MNHSDVADLITMHLRERLGKKYALRGSRSTAEGCTVVGVRRCLNYDCNWNNAFDPVIGFIEFYPTHVLFVVQHPLQIDENGTTNRDEEIRFEYSDPSLIDELIRLTRKAHVAKRDTSNR